jgi:signal transduction histidine kinase
MGVSSPLRARLTIRVRLTALAVLIVGVGLVAGSAVVLALVEDNLLADAENTARQRARDTAALVAAGQLPSTVDDRLVQVVSRDRQVIAASPELTGQPPLLSSWPSAGLELLTQDDQLVVAVPTTYAGAPVAVYAASSLDAVTDGVDATSSALLIAVPALLAIIGWASWLLVGRTLRPVEVMRGQVASITAHELGRRVPEPQARDELGRLAVTMNEMLARLQDAHARLERFTADAAHELRSPLAAILTQLEVGLAHPGSTDWVRLAREVHHAGTRLSRLADELLALSRGDDARVIESVDLDELVLAEVHAVRARGKVTVDLSALSAVRLPARPDDLRRVVRNLLDNAEHHATAVVTVALVADGQVADLTITDDGPGIPAAERELVFERFYRSQPARDRDTGGAGLGLAIARELVTAHHGRIWVADSPAGAELHVRLPLRGRASVP